MMAKRYSHPDVEFSTGGKGVDRERIFDTWEEACASAIELSLYFGTPWNLDVLVYSDKGANWWGGESAVEEYREDPDASVFQRFVINADGVGRVP